MEKKVAVLFADGFEEIEAVSAVDYLRRAGADVSAVGITGREVTGSRKLRVTVDSVIHEAPYGEDSLPDAVVIPGGMPGALNIGRSADARRFVTSMMEHKKFVAAICAAPVVVLAPWGLIRGRRFTCYPGMENELEKYCGQGWKDMTAEAVFSRDRVVCDGTLVTSRGPGTAEEFSLALIREMYGAEKAGAVASAAVVRG